MSNYKFYIIFTKFQFHHRDSLPYSPVLHHGFRRQNFQFPGGIKRFYQCVDIIFVLCFVTLEDLQNITLPFLRVALLYCTMPSRSAACLKHASLPGPCQAGILSFCFTAAFIIIVYSIPQSQVNRTIISHTLSPHRWFHSVLVLSHTNTHTASYILQALLPIIQTPSFPLLAWRSRSHSLLREQAAQAW